MAPVPSPRQASRQLRIICFAMASLTAALLMGTFLGRSAQAQVPRLASIVYTESNIPTENSNSILGFRRDGSGNLTPLSTSPFLTGGTGIAPDPTFQVLPVFDTDQNVIVNTDRTRLFAVNSGSNTIAVFDIHADGSLSPVKGSPFPSGGVNPVSLGLARDFLYVVNKNRDPEDSSQEASGTLANYTGFRVTNIGSLIPIPNSTVSVPSGSDPTQALISPDKRLLFGAEQTSSLLRSFTILPDGRLLESPNSPLPLPASEFPAGGPPPQPLGLQVHPSQPILYVGFVTINKIGVYAYDRTTGALAFLKAVSNSGRAPCWLITNRAGTRLYSANTADNSVTVYDLADPTTPVEIQRVKLNGSFGFATQLALDLTESFLQVVDRRNSPDTTEGNGLHVLDVNRDGTLSEVSSSPLPLPSVDNSFTQGIAVVESRF